MRLYHFTNNLELSPPVSNIKMALQTSQSSTKHHANLCTLSLARLNFSQTNKKIKYKIENTWFTKHLKKEWKREKKSGHKIGEGEPERYLPINGMEKSNKVIVSRTKASTKFWRDLLNKICHKFHMPLHSRFQLLHWHWNRKCTVLKQIQQWKQFNRKPNKIQ